MKNQFKLLAMAATLTLGFGACSSEDVTENLPSSGKTPVEFTMGVSGLTRTSTPEGTLATAFESTDEVGIFTSAGASNVQYTFNGAEWSSENAIYAEDGVAVSYYAYYPYSAEAGNTVTTVPVAVLADQSNEENYSKSDVLLAQAKDVTGTDVTLTYEHAFALVQVELKGTLAGNGTVTLPNLMLGGTADLTTGSVTVGSQAGTVTMQPFSTNADGANGYKYRAIVPAQTINQGDAVVEIALNDKTYRTTASANVVYEAGKYTSIIVNLGEKEGDPIKILVGGTAEDIKDWEQSTQGPTEGEGEEVVTPITSLDLTTEIKADMQFSQFGVVTTDRLTDAADYWYKRVNSGSDPTVSYDDAEQALKAAPVVRGSWDKIGYGYHCGTKVLDRNATYRLTFQFKSTLVANSQLGIGLRNSADTKTFRISDKNSGKRCLYTHSIKTGEENIWQSITVTFDLTQATETTNVNDSEFVATTDEDVNSGFTLLFFNNTDPTSQSYTTWIKEIKLEKVVEEPAE